METDDVLAMLEDLDSNVDSLEESLAPLLKSALSAHAGKLPLLDKAKLYVLATYAVESMLFSTLRLNGIEAKSHPVFAELNRVKEYFEKIKIAEAGPIKRTSTLDKDAAGRFIRHGLSGNERYDRERAERQAGEKAGAKRKLEDMSGMGTHTRFESTARRIAANDGDIQSDSPDKKSRLSKEEKKAAKRQRRLDSRHAKQSPADSPARESVQESSDDDDGGVAIEKSTKSSSAPKSQSQALQALLERKSTANSNPKEKKKKKRKDNGHTG